MFNLLHNLVGKTRPVSFVIRITLIKVIESLVKSDHNKECLVEIHYPALE